MTRRVMLRRILCWHRLVLDLNISSPIDHGPHPTYINFLDDVLLKTPQPK
jgi:hypothetical protein